MASYTPQIFHCHSPGSHDSPLSKLVRRCCNCWFLVLHQMTSDVEATFFFFWNCSLCLDVAKFLMSQLMILSVVATEFWCWGYLFLMLQPMYFYVASAFSIVPSEFRCWNHLFEMLQPVSLGIDISLLYMFQQVILHHVVTLVSCCGHSVWNFVVIFFLQ